MAGGVPPGYGGGNVPPGGGYGGPPGGYGGPPGGYGGPPGGGYGGPAGGNAPPGGGYGGPAGAGYGPPGYGQGGPGASPHAPYGIDPVSGLPFSDKQKIVAMLLQLLLGFFGAGRFYTGHTLIAVLQLLFGWMTCGIWQLVDAILMGIGKVPDAQGRPLRD